MEELKIGGTAMPPFNIAEILRKSEEDYEKAWVDTAKLVRLKGRYIEWKKENGQSHPIVDLIAKIRRVLLSYGFRELINPTIVDESEVYKQYGPEAPVILDRCYYLATLPRPDLGIEKAKIEEIRRIAPSLNDEKLETLKSIFRMFKEGEVSGEDLVEEMVKRLEVREDQATAILSLFPELRKLKPIPTTLTLRSHMTSLWFPVLSRVQDMYPKPIKLFSIGIKYRREQRLDPLHLYESHVASLVVLNDEITLEDGQELVKLILSELGFGEARFVTKVATSKYYAPGTEVEVFVEHGGRWVEVGDIGLYSPVSLARYGIRYPVFNAGFGVERIAMILYGCDDVRVLAYPQLYAELKLSDQDIASSIELIEEPSTNEGRALMLSIIEAAERNRDLAGPCEVNVFSGTLFGKRVSVVLYEDEEGVKLLGPAALNRLYVLDGNLIGVPEEGMEDKPVIVEARRRGVATKYRYLDGVAALVAKRIEEAALGRGEPRFTVRVKMVKSLADINLRIPEYVQRYITSRHKRIDVRGPMFLGIRVVVE